MVWRNCTQNFESQHRSITNATHNQQGTSLRKHDYFTDNEFDRTEESYLEQKGLILDILIDYTSRNGHRGHAVEVTCCFVSKWAFFRDLFTSLILKDLSLSGAKRLHYLKICLRVEAALLLTNRTITDGNFVRLAYGSDIKLFIFSWGNNWPY